MTTLADLQRLIVPRLVDEFVPHVPHPPQQLLLTLDAKEAFYGGAAGGGKSDAILMAASQYVDVPGYAALIVRRTWPDLSKPGAILDRAKDWWMGTRAKPKEGGRVWEFPTSNPDLPARITFGHLQYENDKYQYQGSEFAFIAFDELTQFEEDTYLYLFSRLRTPRLRCLTCNTSVYQSRQDGQWKHKRAARKNGAEGKQVCAFPVPDMIAINQYTPAPDGTTLFDVPNRMRSTSNPGGIGHEWVKRRYIDPKTKVPGAVYIPALLKDNPSLDEEEYTKTLELLGPVERERLLRGDWDVLQEGGWFKRTWWKFIDDIERFDGKIIDWVRYWDLAASLDGDYSVGWKMGVSDDGRYLVTDIIRGRWRPHEVEMQVRKAAEMDGRGVRVCMEQEPGSAGVSTVDHYARVVLPGFWFKPIKVTGPKEERVRPLSSSVEKGHVTLVTANWNVPLMDEAELFPNGAYDDQVDAGGGALLELSLSTAGRVIV